MEDSNRNFKLQTCEDFIEVLASKAAVPGGGGAAALTRGYRNCAWQYGWKPDGGKENICRCRR